MDADIRFAGSTEYSARALRIALVFRKQENKMTTHVNEISFM